MRGHPIYPTAFLNGSEVFQDFVHVPSGEYQRGFDYFASVGWFPQTLATENYDGGWFISGAYRQAPSAPVTRTFQTFDQYQSDFEFWAAHGWRPRTNTTLTANSSSTRYSAVYTPITNPFWTSHQITAGWFNDRFAELWSTHELMEAEPYVESGQLFFIGTWEERLHNGYAMYYGLTWNDFWARDVENFPEGLFSSARKSAKSSMRKSTSDIAAEDSALPEDRHQRQP